MLLLGVAAARAGRRPHGEHLPGTVADERRVVVQLFEQFSVLQMNKMNEMNKN